MIGSTGRLMLVAYSRLLGLIGQLLHAAIAKYGTISEIASIHTHLTPSRLHQRPVAIDPIWQFILLSGMSLSVRGRYQVDAF